jgi:hypothetical protein
VASTKRPISLGKSIFLTCWACRVEWHWWQSSVQTTKPVCDISSLDCRALPRIASRGAIGICVHIHSSDGIIQSTLHLLNSNLSSARPGHSGRPRTIGRGVSTSIGPIIITFTSTIAPHSGHGPLVGYQAGIAGCLRALCSLPFVPPIISTSGCAISGKIFGLSSLPASIKQKTKEATCEV